MASLIWLFALSFFFNPVAANATLISTLQLTDAPQSFTNDPIRKESQPVISVLLNGAPHFVRVDCIVVSDPLGDYSLLRIEPIRNEVGLDDSSQGKLESIIQKAIDVRIEMRSRMLVSSSPKLRQEAMEWFHDEQKTFVDSIAGILTTGQKKRLQEIRHRVTLRKHGWINFLNRCRANGLIDWELDASERANLANVSAKLREELLTDAKKLHEELLLELFEHLSDSQREWLQKTAHKLIEPTGWLDLFREQLDVNSIDDDLHRRQLGGDGSEVELLFLRINRAVFYVLDEDGSLVRHRPGHSDTFKVSLRPDYIEWYADLFDSLVFGELGIQIGIIEPQSDLLIELLGEIASLGEFADKFLENSENLLVDTENLIDMQNFVQGKIRQKMEGFYTDAQLQKLENLVDFADLARFGLLPNLMEGRIGKALGISHQQKRALTEYAEGAVKRIDDFCRERENRCIDELAKCLSPDHRDDFLRIVGAVPTEMRASLFLLAESLSQLEEK